MIDVDAYVIIGLSCDFADIPHYRFILVAVDLRA